MTKEEKIIDAFGKSWSLLSYSMQQHILKVHHWVDRSSNRMNKSPKDLGFDEGTECEIYCEFWRPKSLSGIENNNGWIMLPLKEFLPTGFYFIRLYVPETNIESYIVHEVKESDSGMLGYHFGTHYQPIILNPIIY